MPGGGSRDGEGRACIHSLSFCRLLTSWHRKWDARAQEGRRATPRWAAARQCECPSIPRYRRGMRRNARCAPRFPAGPAGAGPREVRLHQYSLQSPPSYRPQATRRFCANDHGCIHLTLDDVDCSLACEVELLRLVRVVSGTTHRATEKRSSNARAATTQFLSGGGVAFESAQQPSPGQLQHCARQRVVEMNVNE